MHPVLANLGNFFGVDGLIILGLGLLIFGRRVPEVVNNIARMFREALKMFRGTPNPLNDGTFVIGAPLILVAALLANLVASNVLR